MSGLEHMRARLAECEALIGLMGGGQAAPAILVVRAAAWRDAIEAVAADYAAAEPEEEGAEEEEATATGEADEDEPDDAVLAPASAIRAWAEKHGVAVNRMGFIPPVAAGRHQRQARRDGSRPVRGEALMKGPLLVCARGVAVYRIRKDGRLLAFWVRVGPGEGEALPGDIDIRQLPADVREPFGISDARNWVPSVSEADWHQLLAQLMRRAVMRGVICGELAAAKVEPS